MGFQNISVFTNTSDYLPIFNAVLITDLLVIFLLLSGVIKSTVLKKWYKELTLSAVIADILILFIGILLARFFYPHIFTQYSLSKFIGLAVCIQVVHDILFYQLSKAIPRGQSKIMDIFKDYGKEVGVRAILSDSAMMVSSILIASLLKGQGLNANLITLIGAVYVVPYAIYSINLY
jgi:hypothetical protein